MANFPPLEFTLDGPGLSLEQIGAALGHQQEMKAKRAAREAAAAAREAPVQAREPGGTDHAQ